MRTSLLFLFVTVGFFKVTNLTAQSVGINKDGSDPHPSAMLDVKSNNQGILIPRMQSSQRTAIASPADGLMVYDTDTKSFWYFKLNTWTEVGALPLPYNKLVYVNGDALTLANGYAGGNAIVGQAFDGAGISGYSESGAGGVFSSGSGPGIRTIGSGAEINGSLKIADGSQGADRVLTSDAAGLASWKPLPFASAKTAMTSLFDFNSSFGIFLTLNHGHNLLPFVTNPTTIPSHESYAYDAGGNFNNATHEYVVPADGLYRISFKLTIDRPLVNVLPEDSEFYVQLSKLAPTDIEESWIHRSWSFEFNAGHRYPSELAGEAPLYLQAGTKLKLRLYYRTPGAQHVPIKLLGGRYSFFSIVRIE